MGLTSYLFSVCVELKNPIKIEGEEGSPPTTAAGYYINIGITASAVSEAREIAERVITDGEIEWSESSWREVTVSDLDSTIRTRSDDWTQEGVWYKSGLAFYPDESN